MPAVPVALPASTRVLREELASTLTAGIGAFGALAGAVVLVTFAARDGNGWQLGGAIVFSACLLLLHLSSTLYHAARQPAAKRRLKVLDHCAIYLLIAGTYTPFTLNGLRQGPGWWLFIAIWTLAALGVVFKLFSAGRLRLLSTAIYIVMGWLIVVAIKPAWHAFDAWTLGWLLAGGLTYTLGTVFYHRDSLPFSHAVWHLFVIGGSVCHYVAVLAQIQPDGVLAR